MGFLGPVGIPGGRNLSTGDVYSLFVMNNSSDAIVLTTTVTTGQPDLALVPLPAGVWFLLAGLGAMAALRRRAQVRTPTPI